jgi:riboflavin synthase
MFTGIIETTGKIESIESHGTNLSFWISSPISNELKIDQSVSHDGVCLTVENISNNKHRVTAIEKTLEKTNLRNRKVN